jgi:DEAD/DEAH box helicase domain-containing protein
MSFIYKPLFEALDCPVAVNADVYDGDTTSYKRTKIRNNPPNIILTNPEMLHLLF